MLVEDFGCVRLETPAAYAETFSVSWGTIPSCFPGGSHHASRASADSQNNEASIVGWVLLLPASSVPLGRELVLGLYVVQGSLCVPATVTNSTLQWPLPFRGCVRET